MKTLPALLCAAALMLGVSGCGGGGARAGEVSPPPAPTAEAPAAQAEKPDPAQAAPSASPAPVNATVDEYIAGAAASLLTGRDVTKPDDLRSLIGQVDTPTLKGILAWMENNGLSRYISSAGGGGIYLQEDEEGLGIGIYAGSYEDGLRSGERCAWFTIRGEDEKLFIGGWSADYPEGAFMSYTLTTNSGNLIAFSGACRQGVWDGPVNVRYTAPGENPLKGIFACDMGVVEVALRPDGQFWNSDTDDRFCFLALSGGGGRHIPLYRNWSDRYFVTVMAYDASLIGQ